MILATESVTTLGRSDGFTNLETCGMDYHRRRPQSVEHSSPRREAVVQSEAVTTFSHFADHMVVNPTLVLTCDSCPPVHSLFGLSGELEVSMFPVRGAEWQSEGVRASG